MQNVAVGVTEIPEWYLTVFEVLTRTDGYLRNIDTELCHLMESEGLEEGVRTELRLLHDGLREYKVQVVWLEKTLRETFDGVLEKAA